MSKYELPCTPEWVPGIYQLEITDRIQGYNEVTGEDGPVNAQPLALGNRTLYLKQLLDADHTDGHHVLTNDDFLLGAHIPESALALDVPTQEIRNSITQTSDIITGITDYANRLDDVSLSLSGAMRKLIPLSWKYAGTTNEYDLFTDSVAFRDTSRTPILKEIAGDESLDVEDSSQLKVGETYILCGLDGSDPEVITVSAILTDIRIRCTSRLTHTRNTGLVSATNLVIDSGTGTAYSDFTYLSRYTDVLIGAEYGKMYIRRDTVASVGGSVYMEVNNNWVLCPLISTITHTGYTEDIYQVDNNLRTKFRIMYSGGQYPYKMYSIVLCPVVNVVWIEVVRCPTVLSAEKQGNSLLVTSSQYGSLYNIPRRATEARYSTGRGMVGSVTTGSSTGDEVILPLNISTGTIYVQVRHIDSEGAVSRWSASVAISLD